MNLQNVKNPVINGGKHGILTLTSIFDIKDTNHQNVCKTIPDLLNKANQKNVASFREARPFLVVDEIRDQNFDVLYAASPIATRTVGALESKLPLTDLPQENGNAYFKGEFYGETVFIVGSKDKLIEAAKIVITLAGIEAGLNENQINQQIAEKLSTPGVFVAMESNYEIVGASKDGRSYTILADDMPAEQLARALRFYFGNFEDGQKRKIDAALGIPTGDLTSDKLGLETGLFYYRKPSSAVLCVDYGNLDCRFLAYFGDVDDYGRFGGAQWQQSLIAVVLNGTDALLKTDLTTEQREIVIAMQVAAKTN